MNQTASARLRTFSFSGVVERFKAVRFSGVCERSRCAADHAERPYCSMRQGMISGNPLYSYSPRKRRIRASFIYRNEPLIRRSSWFNGEHGGLLLPAQHARRGPDGRARTRRRARPAELEAEAVTPGRRDRGAPRRACTSCTCRRQPAFAEVRAAARARRRRHRGDVPAVSVPRHRSAGGTRRQVVRVHPTAARPWHVEELWHGTRRVRCRRSPRSLPVHGGRPTAGTHDHAGGYVDFTEIPGGLPGIETRMGLVWEGVSAGRIRLPIGCASTQKRRRAPSGCGPRREASASAPMPTSSFGNSSRDQSLDARALHMAVDHSPYHGMTVHGVARAGFHAAIWSRTTRCTSASRRTGRYVSRATPPS